MTIIVGLRGGFGNQLFIAAGALSLASRTGSELIVDHRRVLRPNERGIHIRTDLLGPALECRDWGALFATLKVIRGTRVDRSVSRRLPYRKVEGFRVCRDIGECASALAAGADVLMDGYFQDDPDVERWRGDGTLDRVAALIPDPDQQRGPISARSGLYTAVHVRRGDYVALERVARRLGVCTADYFTAAVHGLDSDHPVVLVTDDPDWCEQALVPRLPTGTQVARGGSAMSDFALLRQADRLVLSNSTFSWWAAVLGRPEAVVAPVPWFNVPEAGGKNVIQPGWIRRGKTTGDLLAPAGKDASDAAG